MQSSGGQSLQLTQLQLSQRNACNCNKEALISRVKTNSPDPDSPTPFPELEKRSEFPTYWWPRQYPVATRTQNSVNFHQLYSIISSPWYKTFGVVCHIKRSWRVWLDWRFDDGGRRRHLRTALLALFCANSLWKIWVNKSYWRGQYIWHIGSHKNQYVHMNLHERVYSHHQPGSFWYTPRAAHLMEFIFSRSTPVMDYKLLNQQSKGWTMDQRQVN